MKFVLWIMAFFLLGAWVINMVSSALGSTQTALQAWLGAGILMGLGWALHLLEKIRDKP